MSLLTRGCGGVLVLLGIALNRWTLERFVLYDGKVESDVVSWTIAAAELALVGAGMWLVVRAPRLSVPSVGNLLLLGFSSLLAVALCEPLFRVLDSDYKPAPRAYVGQHDNRESKNFVPDPDTGWRMRSNRAFEWTFDDRAATYQSNRQGFRAERDFGPAQGPVIALAGDSFAWGTGVEYNETFGALLEGRLVAGEVRNFAMPGFGVDQMWMSVRHQALPLGPALIIVSFIDNDFTRSLTAYRRGEGFNKPKFKLAWSGELNRETEDDAPGALGLFLQSHLTILTALGEQAQSLRPFGDWWELNLTILEQIAEDCAKARVPVLFLRLPQKGQRGFEVLGRELTERGLSFIDAGSYVGESPKDLYLITDGHMNAAGHALLAAIIEDWLWTAHPELLSQTDD